MFQRVAEFHRLFGHPVADAPVLPEQAIRDLRISLINEELNEYRVAYEAGDKVEQADALADLLYVLAGAAVVYGVATDEPFESPYDDADPLEGFPSNHYEALRYEFSDYLVGEKSDDLYLISKGIFHMMLEIFFVARQSRIPINAVFAEVHRSNLSKLGPDGKPIIREDGKILKGAMYSPPDIQAVLDAHVR